MSPSSASSIKIAIISDTHVMAPQLLVSDGTAIEEYLTRDRKMLRESAEILDTLVASILELKPNMVLVTGDLTKDGEPRCPGKSSSSPLRKASHRCCHRRR